MTTLVLVAAALVIITKAADCLTTLRAVPVADAETNPLARGLMRRLSVRGAVTLVFVFACLWTCGAAALVLAQESSWASAGFVALALFVALVQGAVAHTNRTGRLNGVTVRVLAAHELGARTLRARTIKG